MADVLPQVARPIWSGRISFGLVNIPVSLYSAEQSNELNLKLVDSKNKAGIKYQRVNEVTGEEVPWDRIVKGYEYEDGEFVLLSDEDFKSAAPEASQTVDIEEFVPTESIPPEFFEKPYYVVPGKRGEKSYALLREALKKSGRAGVARVVIRTKQYLSVVLARDDVLVLELLRFPHEIREAPAEKIPGTDLQSLKISAKELALAQQLIESMEAEWDPASYSDDYQDNLMAYINKKIAKGQTDAVKHAEGDKTPAKGEVIDMMALLKQSMERNAGKTKKSHKGSTKSSQKKTG